jgi:uncharacterized membrane protein
VRSIRSEEHTMQLTPTIAIHMTAALGAVVTGPVALWARKGARQRPRLHRAFGYTWVALMLVTAITALFIRDTSLPNLAGYTPIHLLVPVTLAGLFGAFWKLARRDIAGHRAIMQRLYFFACLVAGVFTLLPQRYLGGLLWGQLSGLRPIVQGTPLWVWGVLAALLVLGWSQSRERTASVARVTALPIGLVLFSLFGALSAFGRSPLLPQAMGLWLGAAILVTALLAAGRSSAGFDTANRTFTLPGSWIPLLLFVAMFAVRYVVAVRLAVHPQLSADGGFTLPVAALYGAFSGLFLGRAAQLWRLVLRPRVALAA